VKRNNSTQKKYLLGLGGIIVVIAVLVVAITHVRSVSSGSPTPTPTPQYDENGPNVLGQLPPQEQPKMTDLSPDAADKDKAIVMVQHADGSFEEYFMVPEDIDAFIKRLPKVDKLILVNPPASIMAPFYTPEP
jgi:hypothetical protein